MSSPTKHSISPLQARMIEDMTARGLQPKTQTGHIRSCRRFAVWLGRSPDTATPEDVRRFQLDLAADNVSIPTRNAIMTGVKFLFRTTLRRHDLVAEVFCLFSKHVDHLTFPLISPLSSNNSNNWHYSPPKAKYQRQ